MLNNSRILVDSDEERRGGENMGEFAKDPGGHRVTDPGVGWHNEPGGGGWKCNEEPGTGWKSILGPGTGV
jgi:hypothetical protein